MVNMLINGLSLGSVYAMIAVGYALIFNILKFSNFSHGSVMAVCAYAGYYFSLAIAGKVSETCLIVLTLLFCIITGTVVGLVVERMAFWQLRKKNSPSIYYFISSITMGILLENLITIFAGNNFYSYPFNLGSKTFQLFGATIGVTDVLMLGISIAVLAILMVVIFKTKVGVAMRAVSLDTITAGLMGINVNVIVIGTFIVAGILAGIGGMFLATSYTLYPQLGKLVVKGFIASVVGGLGSLKGAVIGALLLGITEMVLFNLVGSGYTPVVVFLIMILFLLLRPRGIAGVVIQEKV